MDAVFDAIGGSHLIKSYKTLRKNGCLINYGFSSALATKSHRMFTFAASFVLLLMLKGLPDGHNVAFYNIAGFKKQHPDWFREDITSLFDLLAQGQIKPIISDRLPLTQAAHAHKLLARSAVHGQLVLLCTQEI